MSELSPKSTQAVRDALTARARVLRDELGTSERQRADALVTLRAEVEDAGEEAEVRRDVEVHNAEERRDQAELRDIGAALARLEAGSYGACIDCGVAIPPARMQAQPSAARCIACQERAETPGPTAIG